MEDSESVIVSPRMSLDPRVNSTSGKLPISCLVASAPKCFSQKTLNCITSVKNGIKGNKNASDLGLFLLTTAALEIVRRISRTRCPFVWQGLQALQLLCYPPFRWIQKWAPFKGLVKSMQALSRPMLVLSIATVFSDQPTCKKVTRKRLGDSREYPELQSDTSSELAVLATRSVDNVPKDIVPEKWLVELREELHKEGLSLPERFEDELVRFYTASNFEYSRLVASVKKTILWRQSYNFLSLKELESWSNWVFWHGCDTRQRPCLIIRLGLACSILRSNEKPLLARAVVSQIEHMIVKLVESREITVLMDCEGLSPLGFPIQTMRCCAILLQDHYPRRLGCLMVIRLPVFARFISKALFQVLKPATRKKLRIVEGNFEEVLNEFLQPLPVFLGGNCSCSKCLSLSTTNGFTTEEINRTRHIEDYASVPSSRIENDANVPSSRIENEPRESDSNTLPPDSTRPVETDSNAHSPDSCIRSIESEEDAVRVVNSPDFYLGHTDDSRGKREELIRAGIIGIIVFWVFVAFVLRKYLP